MTNLVLLKGRLVAELETISNRDGNFVGYSGRIAVWRPNKREGQQDDFFRILIFGREAEGIQTGRKPLPKKGDAVSIQGSLHNQEKYTNKEGRTVYPDSAIYVNSLDAVKTVPRQDGQTASQPAPQPQATPQPAPQASNNGFMNIPEGLEDELPFV